MPANQIEMTFTVLPTQKGVPMAKEKTQKIRVYVGPGVDMLIMEMRKNSYGYWLVRCNEAGQTLWHDTSESHLSIAVDLASNHVRDCYYTMEKANKLSKKSMMDMLWRSDLGSLLQAKTIIDSRVKHLRQMHAKHLMDEHGLNKSERLLVGVILADRKLSRTKQIVSKAASALGAMPKEGVRQGKCEAVAEQLEMVEGELGNA